MIDEWVSRHDPLSVFLTVDDETLTYGDLTSTQEPSGGQIVVTPGSGPDSVVELMTVPGPGRQMIVMDPRVNATERERRLRLAAAGVERSAMSILFTSGTTGPAKAVRLTATNWQAAVAGSARHLRHRRTDVWLAAMPLHHVGGLSILYRSAFVGATVRWVPRFDTAAVASELRSGVTMVSVVPTMLRRILDHDGHSYTGLRAVLVGGGPIPAGLLEEASGRGLPVLPTYGMTETCAQVATLRPGSPVRYGAHLLDEVEIRIGERGRIELRGDQVFPGYADEDDRLPGRWFRTPDLGQIDSDGLLTVLGRADDVIISGGENVNPVEVESVLCSHPSVAAAVIVGVEDTEWGEKVVGVYEGGVEPDQLRDWARDRLSPAELPKSLVRVPAIPWLGTKADRGEVRRLLSRS